MRDYTNLILGEYNIAITKATDAVVAKRNAMTTTVLHRVMHEIADSNSNWDCCFNTSIGLRFYSIGGNTVYELAKLILTDLPMSEIAKINPNHPIYDILNYLDDNDWNLVEKARR